MKTTVLGERAELDESTLEGEVIKLGIHEGAREHILSTLQNLYQDPPTAILREYGSNALDAHARTKQTRPIEITIPDTPFGNHTADVTIQDFGLGMDKADLARYGSYGWSDKRDSNEERGGFGLGSKSAFSIASEWGITSVKNGVRYDVKAHRTSGLFQILSETETDEPNGVTIRVPMKAPEIERIRAKAPSAFYGFPQNSVLINGKPIAESIYSDEHLIVKNMSEISGWVKIAPKVSNRFGSAFSDPLIVIGGIIYDVPRGDGDIFNSYNFHRNANRSYLARADARLRVASMSGNQFYINLPIGSLKLTPARDAIKLTEGNKSTIAKAFDQFFDLLPTAAGSHLNRFKTATEALDFYAYNFNLLHDTSKEDGSTFRNNMASGDTPDATWHGRKVPHLIEIANTWIRVDSHVGRGIDDSVVKQNFTFINAYRNENKGYAFKGERTMILRVPKIDDALIKEVRQHVRLYGQHKLGTDFLSTYITADENLDQWVTDTLFIETLDGFRETGKIARKLKRENRQPAQRRTLAYLVLEPGKTSLTSINAEELPKAVYYLKQEDTAQTYNTYDGFWDIVKDESTERDVPEKYLRILGALSGQPLIILPKSRSENNLLKFVPDATNLTATLAVKSAEYAKSNNFDSTVLKEIYALAKENRSNHTTLLSQIATANPSVVFTDKVMAEVAKQIAGHGDAYAIIEGIMVLDHGITKYNQEHGIRASFKNTSTNDSKILPVTTLFARTAHENLSREKADMLVTGMNAILSMKK
jgi:hypothetical protein